MEIFNNSLSIKDFMLMKISLDVIKQKYHNLSTEKPFIKKVHK